MNFNPKSRTDRDRMRKFIANATQGDWQANGWHVETPVTRIDDDGCPYQAHPEPVAHGNAHDCLYIAAFDPPTVTVLLDALDEMERERDAELKAARDRIGLERAVADEQQRALRACKQSRVNLANGFLSAVTVLIDDDEGLKIDLEPSITSLIEAFDAARAGREASHD